MLIWAPECSTTLLPLPEAPLAVICSPRLRVDAPLSVMLTPELMVMLLLASSVSVAAPPEVLAMLLATVMLPASGPGEPARPVEIFTLVPLFRLVWMSLARMVEVAVGLYWVPGVAPSLSP